MEVAFGRLQQGGRAACGGAPTFVEPIVGDREAANIVYNISSFSISIQTIFVELFSNENALFHNLGDLAPLLGFSPIIAAYSLDN